MFARFYFLLFQDGEATKNDEGAAAAARDEGQQAEGAVASEGIF